MNLMLTQEAEKRDHIIFEKQSNTQGKRSFICWFVLQITSVASAGSDWSREPGTSSGSPVWVVRVPEPSRAALLGVLTGSQIRNGAAVDNTCGGLMCWTTVLASVCYTVKKVNDLRT